MTLTREQQSAGGKASIAKKRAASLAHHDMFELVTRYGIEGMTASAVESAIATGLEIAAKVGTVRVETAEDIERLSKALRNVHTVVRLQLGQSTSNEAVVSMPAAEYDARLVAAQQRLDDLRNNTVAIPPPSPAT